MWRVALATQVLLLLLLLSVPARSVPFASHARSEANTAGASSSRTLLNGSRCSSSSGAIDCAHDHMDLQGRWVGYQVPLGAPPPAGWPLVVLFHGWNLWNSLYCWYATPEYTNGLFHKAETVRGLLDSGFAVVTPDALGRLAYWQTNMNRYAVADLAVWTESEDHRFVMELLQLVGSGRYGPVDASRISAIGFSSGGYMTSRMAVNYPFEFKAFVVVGGSYYYCAGSCTDDIADRVPERVWQNHGPMLFLHGGSDGTVPTATSELYHQRLLRYNVTTRRHVQLDLGHAWVDNSAAEVTRWLMEHG